ncbi:MAG TPA: hypothetical protein VM818_20875 [Vicinamibacterales bacterium]|nr:hypothetical protein [Vicinamibacterales bacterium]
MRHRVLTLVAALVLTPSALLAQGAEGSGPELFAQGRRAKEAAQPAPRWPDGRVNLGASPGETGIWLPIDARISLPDKGPGRGPGAAPDAPRYDKNVKCSAVPFQPWARMVFMDRLNSHMEPHSRCKPSGGPRQIMTPYGVEFVDLPEAKQMLIVDVGGPHMTREVYMDGRPHPKNLIPSYYGHNVGHWEGDTLVIDSVGYNEAFWLDREGNPHTERLHLVERFTRVNMNTLKYEVTVDDPGAYTAPWTGGFYLEWTPDTELFEYVCQENNFASTLLVGGGSQESVDRPSQIVP